MRKNYQGTVFFDLDCTLLNAESQVDDDVALAMHQLKDNGYLPVICTGRAPNEIPHVTAPTGIDTYITLNGALVQSQNETVFENSLDIKDIESVMKQAKELGDSISFHTEEETFLNEVTPTVVDFYKSVHLPLPTVDPDYYKSHKLPMIIVISNEGPERYQKNYDNLTFYKTGKYSIDTVNHGVTKMSGILHLLEGLDLMDKPVYAFGDGSNDLPMIQQVKHSVAMGNGIDAVKEAAEYVTSANTDGGIIKGLKHYNLI